MLLASSLKNNLHVLIFKAESHNSIYLKGKNIICVTSHAKAKDQSSNSNQWRARLALWLAMQPCPRAECAGGKVMQTKMT